MKKLVMLTGLLLLLVGCSHGEPSESDMAEYKALLCKGVAAKASGGDLDAQEEKRVEDLQAEFDRYTKSATAGDATSFNERIVGIAMEAVAGKGCASDGDRTAADANPTPAPTNGGSDEKARSELKAGLDLAGDMPKTAVAEYYSNYNSYPQDNERAGLPSPSSIANDYVSSVLVTDGNIVATYADAADPLIRGKHIQLSPHVVGRTLEFACTSPDVDANILPESCSRNGN